MAITHSPLPSLVDFLISGFQHDYNHGGIKHKVIFYKLLLSTNVYPVHSLVIKCMQIDSLPTLSNNSLKVIPNTQITKLLKLVPW